MESYPECVVCSVYCCSDGSLHGHGHLEVSFVPLPNQLVAAHAGSNLALIETAPLGHALVGVVGLSVQPTGVNDVLKSSIHLTTLTAVVAIDTWRQIKTLWPKLGEYVCCD